MLKERWLSIKDTAVVLNRSYHSVYQLVRSGMIPAIRVGGRRYVSREFIEKVIRGEQDIPLGRRY